MAVPNPPPNPVVWVVVGAVDVALKENEVAGLLVAPNPPVVAPKPVGVVPKPVVVVPAGFCPNPKPVC